MSCCQTYVIKGAKTLRKFLKKIKVAKPTVEGAERAREREIKRHVCRGKNAACMPLFFQNKAKTFYLSFSTSIK